MQIQNDEQHIMAENNEANQANTQASQQQVETQDTAVAGSTEKQEESAVKQEAKVEETKTDVPKVEEAKTA